MNLYHITKFSLYLSLTVFLLLQNITSFTIFSSTRVVLGYFYLPIFYFEKFSTCVCRLSFAVNVILNPCKSDKETCPRITRPSEPNEQPEKSLWSQYCMTEMKLSAITFSKLLHLTHCSRVDFKVKKTSCQDSCWEERGEIG